MLSIAGAQTFDRILLLRQEWLDLILSGSKTWELRGSPTRIRGTIGLAASGTGAVTGLADIVDSVGPLSPDALLGGFDRHRVETSRLETIPYKNVHAWVLKQAVQLRDPIEFEHPRGAVIWVRR